MPTFSEPQKNLWKQVIVIVWFLCMGILMSLNHGVVGWGMGALWGIIFTLVVLLMRGVIKS